MFGGDLNATQFKGLCAPNATSYVFYINDFEQMVNYVFPIISNNWKQKINCTTSKFNIEINNFCALVKCAIFLLIFSLVTAIIVVISIYRKSIDANGIIATIIIYKYLQKWKRPIDLELSMRSFCWARNFLYVLILIILAVCFWGS